MLYWKSVKIAEIFAVNKDSIAKDVLADDIVEGTTTAYSKEWSINGEKVILGVEKQ